METPEFDLLGRLRFPFHLDACGTYNLWKKLSAPEANTFTPETKMELNESIRSANS